MHALLEPLLRDGVEGCVRLDQPVSRIEDRGDHVLVRTEGGLAVRASVCVNTMPVGVLAEAVKSGMLDLSPEKRRAIASTQMGCYKKVFLTFTDIWWPRDEPFLGLVRTEDDESVASPLGNCLLIDNLWACRDIPCLEVVLFGSAGQWATGKSDEVIRDAVVEFLVQAMGSGARNSHCVDVHVTRWEEDPYSRGAYSSVAVGASIRHVQELTRPEWEGRLVLSGEACVSEFEGSVHSALMSGQNAAETVRKFLLSSKHAVDGEHDQTESDKLLLLA
jgi:monoamine oxidase